MKGFRLSNGQYIPPGVHVEVPVYSIYHDNDNYPDSDKFDGFRFFKLRQGGMQPIRLGTNSLRTMNTTLLLDAATMPVRGDSLPQVRSK